MPSNHEASRVVNKDGIAPCVKENHGTVTGVEQQYRIRKLTPKECWRLMGFTDMDFKKAQQALNQTHYKGKNRSSSQLYKQAGNSIVVDVLYYIFTNLYTSMPYLFDNLSVGSFFSGIGAFESALDRLYNDINSETEEIKCTDIEWKKQWKNRELRPTDYSLSVQGYTILYTTVV